MTKIKIGVLPKIVIGSFEGCFVHDWKSVVKREKAITWQGWNWEGSRLQTWIYGIDDRRSDFGAKIGQIWSQNDLQVQLKQPWKSLKTTCDTLNKKHSHFQFQILRFIYHMIYNPRSNSTIVLKFIFPFPLRNIFYYIR